MATYTVPIEELDSLLQSLPANTPSTYYTINVTNIKPSDLPYSYHTFDELKFRSALINNLTKFVYLEEQEDSYVGTLRHFNYTFMDCSNLVGINKIPDSVVTMTQTFRNCSNLVFSIELSSITQSLDHTFMGCTSFNQNIVIPNSVTDMGYCFYNCTSFNQNIVIPNSVTDMGYCFYNCTSFNKNITIPNSVTDMECTFCNCTSFNKNITIPNSVTDMGNCFAMCSNLKQNIVIPRSVTNLKWCFQNCSKLEEITIESDSKRKVDNLLNVIGSVFSTQYPDDDNNYVFKRINIRLFPRQVEDNYYGYHIVPNGNKFNVTVYDRQGEVVRESTNLDFNSSFKIKGLVNHLVFGAIIPPTKIIETLQNKIVISNTGCSGKYDATLKNFILWGDENGNFVNNMNILTENDANETYSKLDHVHSLFKGLFKIQTSTGTDFMTVDPGTAKKVTIDGDITTTGIVQINNNTAVNGTTSQGALIIGSKTGPHVSIDNNEIQGKNNNGVNKFWINDFGGDVSIGNATATTIIKSSLTANKGITVPSGQRITINSKQVPVIETPSGGYPGLTINSAGETNNYIRAPQSGFLPNKANNADGTGNGDIGTSYWKFANLYVDNVHTSYCDAYGFLVSKKTIDLSASSYNVNTYYPCTIVIPRGVRGKIIVYNDLSTNKPSWSTHNAGFSCYYEVEILQSYWGVFNSSNQGRLLKSEFLFCDKNPVSFSTMRQGGSAVIWLRGGGKYYYKTENFNTNAVVRTSTFTEGNISVSPTTSPPSMVASIITTDNFTFNGSQLTLGF